MTSGHNIAFSKKAEKDFDVILNYIKQDFGSIAAVNFKVLVFKFVELLGNFPEIGSLEVPDKEIRCFVLHRRLKIFYRIKSNSIIILKLFDTRQHLNKSI